jgi:L-lactate dehydrogenase (cytochrome)
MVNPIATLKSVVQFERIETDPVERRLGRCANVDDLRRIARRRLPGGVFDYIEGGAEDERTLRANSSAFANTTFNPRVLCGLQSVDISSKVLGTPVPYPLVLAPTGFTRIADPQGELAVARAAAKAGLPYTLSTLSTRSIEEVRNVSDGRLWFQVYAWRDRGLVEEMIQRACASRYEALMLTVDTAVFGRRERDVRRGFSLPPKIGPRTILDGALHPGWTLAFLRNEPIRFANVVGQSVGDGASPVSLSAYVNEQFDPALSWDDIDSPIMVVANLMARPPRFHWSHRWPMRLAVAPRSSATAAFVVAATSSKRLRLVLLGAWPVDRIFMRSGQEANGA